MKKTRITLVPLIVVVAVTALVVGTFGTAQAAGPTKAAVKKIAAKVVDKKAPSLSVAHAVSADTATNATNLGGLPPSAYQNTAYKYTLPVQAASGSRHYTFPGLPAGTYVASYAFTANTSGAGFVTCSFGGTSTGLIAAPNYGANYANSFTRISATAVLTTASGFGLDCSMTAGTYTMNSFNENTVTFVPVSNPVTGSAAAARPAESRPAAGS
jgi:hypothetical protein